jgi:hypothetical protein
MSLRAHGARRHLHLVPVQVLLRPLGAITRPAIARNDIINTMLGFLLSLLAGWPAIVTTVILTVYGLAKNNYRYLLGAAILAVPFSWFLSGFPIIRSPIFLTPALLFGSAWAMRYEKEMLAWLLAIPFFLVVLLLLFALGSGAS